MMVIGLFPLLGGSMRGFFWHYKLSTLFLLSIFISYITYKILFQYIIDHASDFPAWMFKYKDPDYRIGRIYKRAYKKNKISFLMLISCTIEMFLLVCVLIALFNQITLIFKVESVADVSAGSIWYNYFYGTFMGDPFIYLVLPFWWMHEYMVHRMKYFQLLLGKTLYGRFLLKYYYECAQFNWFKTYKELPSDTKTMKYHYILLWLSIAIEFIALGLFFAVGIYHVWLYITYKLPSLNAFKYLLVYGLCYRVNLHFVHYYQNHFLNIKCLKNYYLDGFNMIISMKHNKWIKYLMQKDCIM